LGLLGIAKVQRTRGEVAWEEVFLELKKYRVFSCRYEPTAGEKPAGFSISNWPLLGTKTLRVDLRPSEDKIFSSFTKDCRYALRKLIMNNEKCKINEFENFYEIWKKSAKRKSLWIPPPKEYQALIESFGNNVFCLTADNEAGALMLINKKTVFYYYAGGTKRANIDNLPNLLVWEAMKEAKKRGSLVWDFEGIYDARWPNPGWKGFTHFKKSFGGVEIEYPGSFQKWLWPF
jgi:lipid II:glycine glycyltransferase (peptidoglycan interpeptide bridge formation enzyme)